MEEEVVAAEEVTTTTKDADAATTSTTTTTEVMIITKIIIRMMVTTTTTKATIMVKTITRIRDPEITTNSITTRVLRDLDGITMPINPIIGIDNQLPRLRS